MEQTRRKERGSGRLFMPHDPALGHRDTGRVMPQACRHQCCLAAGDNRGDKFVLSWEAPNLPLGQEQALIPILLWLNSWHGANTQVGECL